MGFFTYDDPPAPQEPPQHHTPLSPRKSRTIFSHHNSLSSDSNRSSTRNPTLVSFHASRPSLPGSGTRSANEASPLVGLLDVLSQPNAASAEGTTNSDSPVTRDKSVKAASISCSPADRSVSALSEACSTNVVAAPLRAHVWAQKNEPAPAPCAAQRTSSLRHKKHSSHTTTTAQRSRSRPSTGPSVVRKQVSRRKSNQVMDRRNSEHDARSMISSLLDAYCRSDTDDAFDEEYPWSDDGSTVFSDDVISLGSAMSSPKGGFSDALRSSFAISGAPQKRRKPSSLLIASPTKWQGSSIPLELPALPQTAPAARSPRPLPPVPAQRSARPLPRPPVPPPYSPTATPEFPPTPSRESSLPASPRASASSSTSSSPSSGNYTSHSSESSISSPSSGKLELDTLAAQPKIFKRSFPIPVITIPPFSSGPPSPLTPDIPVPPSPMTAKRHQASKLSKMLGEDITPELLHDRRRAVHAPPRNKLPITRAQSLSSNRSNRSTGPGANATSPRALTITTPGSTIRGVQTRAGAGGRRTRTGRPQAIYVQDSISEELGETLVVKEERYESEDTGSEKSLGGVDHMGLKVHIAVGEELEEAEHLSSASSREVDSVVTSPTDSTLEEYELDDMEEAHIGWALQNVITYETVSRVKRTSRTWVVEKGGQRWEEQNYDNVLKALRQL